LLHGDSFDVLTFRRGFFQASEAKITEISKFGSVAARMAAVLSSRFGLFCFSDGGCFWSAIWNIRNFYAGSRAHMKKACRRQALVGADGA